MTDPSFAIEASGMHKRYGGVHALRGAGLSVLPGEGCFLVPLRHARAHVAVQLARLGRHASPGLRGLVATQARTGAAWFVLAGRATAHPLPLGFPEAARLAARSSVITTDFLAANTRARERVAAQISRLTAAAPTSLRVALAWCVAALAVSASPWSGAAGSSATSARSFARFPSVSLSPCRTPSRASSTTTSLSRL